MALELTDLTQEERLALVAVLREVAEADKYVSDGEAKRLRGVIGALSRKAYQAAVMEADRRFTDKEELRRFLQTIERAEARELIYETALEVALADVPVRAETDILDWVARIWHLKVQVVDPTAGGSTR